MIENLVSLPNEKNCMFLEGLLNSVTEDSKVYILIPRFLGLGLFAQEYQYLFSLLEDRIGIYPSVRYYKDSKNQMKTPVHRAFLGYANAIQYSKISVQHEIEENDYKVGFFVWDMEYTQQCIKHFIGFNVAEIGFGGFYFLHLDPDGGTSVKTIHYTDLK